MPASAELSLEELAAGLKRAGQQMPAHMEDLRYAMARTIFEEMLSLVPRKSGRLAASIRIKHATGRTEVGPEGVPYAVYIEYGTGQFNEFGGSAYEIRPTSPGGVLAFNVGGKTIFTKRVLHPGIRPQPFIRPALTRAMERAGVDIATTHHRLLTGRAA